MDLKESLEQSLGRSVMEVFRTTFQLDPQVTESPALSPHNGLVTSSIGVTGFIDGNISIWMSETSAANLVSKMLGMEIEENSPDVLDGLGEVINMIAGSTKTNLNDTAYKFDISIPTTLRGIDLESGASGQNCGIVKNYVCGDITFRLKFEYRLHQNNENPSKETTANPAETEETAPLSAADKLSQLLQMPQAEGEKEAL